MLFTFSSSDFSFTGGFCKAAAKADALSFFAKKLETRTPLASTSLSSDIIRFNLTEESAWKICSCETNPKLNKQTLCLRQNRRCRCFGEEITLTRYFSLVSNLSRWPVISFVVHLWSKMGDGVRVMKSSWPRWLRTECSLQF